MRPGPTLAERVAGSPGLARRQALGRALTRALADLEVTGLRHVPAAGPVVLAVNHRAFLDWPLLFGLLARPVTFLVKSEAFEHAVPARVLAAAGQVPVRRGAVDPAPVRLALRVLAAGGVVGMFPEGTRGDGRVRHAQPGAAYLALRTGAAVVPVALHGTASMTARRHPARPSGRPRVRVTVGPALAVTPWPVGTPLPRRVFRAESERVREALAALVAATDPVPPAGRPGPAARTDDRTTDRTDDRTTRGAP